MQISLNQNQSGLEDRVSAQLSGGASCEFFPVEKKFLLSYLEYIKADNNKLISLVEYVRQQHYRGSEIIIVPDLNSLIIAGSDERNLLDLSDVDFRGCLVHNSKFYNCDLTSCNFRDIALDNVIFSKSMLNNCDFRGCDLETTKFDSSYIDPPWNQHDQIKFAMSSSCLRVYADIKNEIARSNEKQRLLDNKRLELLEMKRKLDIFDRLQQFLIPSLESRKYRKIKEEIKIMEKGVFSRRNIIHRSLCNIFSNESNKFDPLYNPGHLNHRKYVQIGKKILLEYLRAQSEKSSSSLNEYTKQKYISSIPTKKQARKYVDNFEIITDLSSKVNMFGNNEWTRLDLRGIHFKNCNLSRVNFTGSDLTDCKFENCDLSQCNFESAELTGALFDNCKVIGAILRNISATRIHIKKSDLSGSNFAWAELDGATITESNFSYLFAPHFRVVKSNIEQTFFCKSNMLKSQLTKCSLTEADFSKCNFEGANINDNKLTSCSFDRSRLLRANFSCSTFTNCNMLMAFAHGANMSEARILAKSNFTATDFSESNFDGVRAPKSNFSRCNFDRTHMGYAKFNESSLENATMRLAKLDNCAFNKANLQNIDYSGAKLFNVRFTGSKCNNSNFQLAILESANFVKSNISDCDWQSLKLENSLLEGTYNHRVRVNDNTEINNSVLRNLNGQFYHYDGDELMTIMFIEQQQSRQKQIALINQIAKFGIFSKFIAMLSQEKSVPLADKKRLLASLKAHKTANNKYRRQLEHMRGEIPRREIFDKINELEGIIAVRGIYEQGRA